MLISAFSRTVVVIVVCFSWSCWTPRSTASSTWPRRWSGVCRRAGGGRVSDRCEDNGLLVGLTEEDLKASLKTLRRMAEKYEHTDTGLSFTRSSKLTWQTHLVIKYHRSVHGSCSPQNSNKRKLSCNHNNNILLKCVSIMVVLLVLFCVLFDTCAYIYSISKRLKYKLTCEKIVHLY